jgi:hypothetical protein
MNFPKFIRDLGIQFIDAKGRGGGGGGGEHYWVEKMIFFLY